MPYFGAAGVSSSKKHCKPAHPCRTAVTTTVAWAHLLTELSKAKRAAGSCAIRPVKSTIWTTLTRGETLDEHTQWESAMSRSPVPGASTAKVSRAASGRGVEQEKEIKMGSSLHTSLEAARVGDALAGGGFEMGDMHLRILGSRIFTVRGDL